MATGSGDAGAAGTAVGGHPPRIRLVLYDKKAPRIFEPASFEEAASLEKRSGGEVWMDITAADLEATLGTFDLCKRADDQYIRDEEDRTVFQVPFISRSSNRVQYLFIVTEGQNRVVTIREDLGSKGPVESTLQFLADLVEEETDEGKMPLPNFRDFVVTAILGSLADEFIASINTSRQRVNRIYEDIIRKSDPIAAQHSIYQVHTFLSEVFGTAIFLFREFVSLVRKGSGNHLKLTIYQNYMEKVLEDVAQAIEMRDGLENTLDLISNTIRATLSDRNIANTERLNRAVELLTRLSVLLMIPNSVFTLWPTLPVANEDTFLGIYSAGWELIIALLLTAAGQVLISRYYRHYYLADIFGQKADGEPPDK